MGLASPRIHLSPVLSHSHFLLFERWMVPVYRASSVLAHLAGVTPAALVQAELGGVCSLSIGRGVVWVYRSHPGIWTQRPLERVAHDSVVSARCLEAIAGRSDAARSSLG